MFSNSKRLGEIRTDFCLWLNIRKLISMFGSVWTYFSIFFLSLSFPDFSQEVKCQKYPETPYQSRRLPCGHCSTTGVFPNHLWTLNLQIIYRSLPCRDQTTSLPDFCKQKCGGEPGSAELLCTVQLLCKCSSSDSRLLRFQLPSGAGNGGVVRLCLCWMLLMTVELSINWAPISSAIAQRKPSPCLLRVQPEWSLTSQRTRRH